MKFPLNTQIFLHEFCFRYLTLSIMDVCLVFLICLPSTSKVQLRSTRVLQPFFFLFFVFLYLSPIKKGDQEIYKSPQCSFLLKSLFSSSKSSQIEQFLLDSPEETHCEHHGKELWKNRVRIGGGGAERKNTNN